MSKKLMIIFSILAAAFAFAGCDNTVPSYITATGKITLNDGSTPLTNAWAKLEYTMFDQGSFRLSGESQYFALSPSGEFSTSISLSSIVEQVNALQVRMTGYVGLLIQDELAGISGSIVEAVTTEIIDSCNLTFVSRWHDVDATTMTSNELGYIQVTQNTSVNIMPADYATLKQCQREVLARLLGQSI